MDQRAALQSALQLAAFFKQNCLKCAVFRAKRGERSVGYNAISSGLVATIAHQWQQPASQAAAGVHRCDESELRFDTFTYKESLVTGHTFHWREERG